MPREQRTRLAAYGVAIRDDQVLLVRASSRSRAPGTWWLPGGGVDFGEDPAAAVVREISEEAGLDAAVTALLGVLSHVEEEPDAIQHSIRIVYRVSVAAGEPRAEENGSSDAAAWVPLSRVKDVPLVSFFREFLPEPDEPSEPSP